MIQKWFGSTTRDWKYTVIAHIDDQEVHRFVEQIKQIHILGPAVAQTFSCGFNILWVGCAPFLLRVCISDISSGRISVYVYVQIPVPGSCVAPLFSQSMVGASSRSILKSLSTHRQPHHSTHLCARPAASSSKNVSFYLFPIHRRVLSLTLLPVRRAALLNRRAAIKSLVYDWRVLVSTKYSERRTRPA